MEPDALPIGTAVLVLPDQERGAIRRRLTDGSYLVQVGIYVRVVAPEWLRLCPR